MRDFRVMETRRNSASSVDLNFSASGYLYATHPMHAFAARCPPPLASWAINEYSPEGGVVLDPMAGSGTTLVEACLSGRQAWGADIDPLARLIAKVKATSIPLEKIDEATARIDELLVKGRLSDKWRPNLPNLERWFRADVASDLARLRRAIFRADPEQDVQDFLWVAYSSLIVAKTSVANTRDLVHSRHHHQAWRKNPQVPVRFKDRIRRMKKMMGDYQRRLERVGGKPVVEVVGDDARALPLRGGQAHLVFTSPPYCSALDYTRAHIFAIAWMQDILETTSDDYRALGRTYVGTARAPMSEATAEQPLPPLSGQEQVDVIVDTLRDTPEQAWIVHRYFREMAAVIKECARVVRPEGHVVLVVCPSNIRKISIPTHQIFADIAEGLRLRSGQLRVQHLFERTIHDRRRLMPYLESAFGPRMRTEYVLVLHRELGTPRKKRRRPH